MGTKCEECDVALIPGELVAIVPGRVGEPARYWHPRCLDASVRPISQRPRDLSKVRAEGSARTEADD